MFGPLSLQQKNPALHIQTPSGYLSPYKHLSSCLLNSRIRANPSWGPRKIHQLPLFSSHHLLQKTYSKTSRRSPDRPRNMTWRLNTSVLRSSVSTPSSGASAPRTRRPTRRPRRRCARLRGSRCRWPSRQRLGDEK